MIAATDIVTLAPGVDIRQELLRDAVRGHAWPLNASGAFVLARAGRPLGAVASELAEAFSLPAAEARGDVVRFVWELNRLALVNVERTASRLGRWSSTGCELAVRLAPVPAPCRPPSRAGARLDTRTAARAISSSLEAVLPRMALVAAVATILAVHVALIVGAGLLVPLLVGLGTGLGLGLHEAAHAALLRGVPSALVVRGPRTRVLHAAVAPSRRALVAVGGPLAVAALGLALVLGGSLTMAPGRDDRRLPVRRPRTGADRRRRRREDRMWALKAFLLGSLAFAHRRVRAPRPRSPWRLRRAALRSTSESGHCSSSRSRSRGRPG